MKTKLRAPARDPVLAEFDAHDIKEVLAYWELPLAVVPAVAPSEESVRRAFEHAGYAVLYFLKLRRSGNQFNEIGLCRQSAAHIEDQPRLFWHVQEILETAGVELTQQKITVSQRGDRMWVNFARLLPIAAGHSDRQAPTS
jgi:hypothetical protein